MDIWLERFVLTLLAAAFLSLVVVDVMKLDATQRVALAISIAAFSYFVGHTINVTRSSTSANRSTERGQDTRPTDPTASQKPVSPLPHATSPSTNASSTIKVTDNYGKPVPGVDVLLLNTDGTHLKMTTTDGLGLVEVGEKMTGLTTMFCAHPHFHHCRRARFDWDGSALSVQMSASPDGGSLVIPDGTGYIPGLDGRLNPILDDQGRTYLYAQNIAIEGGKAQPVSFTVGRPLGVKDSHGHAFRLEIIDIVGSSSLIEYSRHK